MHASKDQQDMLQRLKTRAAFLHVQKQGVRWVSQGLTIQALKNDGDTMRVGFTVTKKTDKSAVKRNRIKRRLRAVAADILPLHAQGGYDYILVGRPQSLNRPYDTLCTDLKWCLKKLNLHSSSH